MKASFAQKVKCVRMKLKLSQSELANAIGVSYATISRWERENREPHMKTVGQLYDFCVTSGIDFDKLGEG